MRINRLFCNLVGVFTFFILAGSPSPIDAADPVQLAKPGALPIDVVVSPINACTDACDIVIEGTITGSQPVTLVFRVDDRKSNNYASRVNDERTLPPGHFTWRKPLSTMRTVNGRMLDKGAVNRAMLFVGKGQAEVKIASLKLIEVPSLPMGAKGLSFGAPDAPIPSGFERVSPGDPRIQGEVFIIKRPAPDPLIANGMRGINKLQIEWPKGRARVSFWNEDPGEWETLPFPTERLAFVNGIEVYRLKQTPPQWMRTRYLAGADQEAKSGTNAWEEFGRHRGNLITVEVDVGDDGIVIEQSGDAPWSRFLSAVLVEPAGQRAALDHVLANRAQWYRETWPVGPDMLQEVAHSVSAIAVAKGDTVASSVPLHLTMAAGTGARASISITSAGLISAPDATIRQPKLDSTRELPVRLWVAQRHLDRISTGANLLAVQDERLRKATRKFPIQPDEKRRYEIWVEAPPIATPGLYKGEIEIGDATRSAVVPLEIEVLPVILPQAVKPSGFYHDEAPHLTWFPWPNQARRKQIGCDLAFLSGVGVNGNAPALSTPVAFRNDEFMADAQIAAQNANVFPWLAYAPATRAIQAQGLQNSITSMADADQRLMAKGYQRLIWSIADEPSNPDVAAGDIKGWVTALRAKVPGIKLAAHLNSRGDRPLVPLFDTVVVNQGYGIDISDIEAIRAKNVEPWLYNTGKPRMTAGLWLWATQAKHYLQWHARMPTADPFDPTDGREGDAQMFFPSMELCAAQPDISADILAMAEGVVDQRWLDWLDSRKEPEAIALATRLKMKVGTRFEPASQLKDIEISAIRGEIMELARSLK